MSIILNPYINFKDQAREAGEFYKSVFGGTLSVTTFKEAGMAADPKDTDKVMHSKLDGDNGIILMLSDVPEHMSPADLKPGNNISISLSGDDEAVLKAYWDKLSVGAKITVPLAVAPWGDTFGMLDDKFGIFWLVNISGKKG